MPEPVTAIVATASVVSAGASIYSAHKQSEQAEEDREAMAEAQEKALAFEKEKYGDFKETYGPIEQNLSNFYQGLSPDYFAALGLENYEKEFTASMEQMKESMAQRGIDSDAVFASLESQAKLERAETRAEIRQQAPIQTAQAKQGFLQVGLGQGAAQSYSQALQNTAGQRSNQYYYSRQQSDAAFADAVGAVSEGIANVAEYV